MKIGLVCPYNIAYGGGVQECVRAMHTELKRRGHQVKIITPQPRDTSKCDKRGVIFMGNAADFHSPLATTTQVSASIDPATIDAMLEREQFDILHFHEPWVPLLSYQILARSNSVNVATFHAKLPGTMMSRTISKVVTPYTKSSLKYLHELVAVSDSAAEYVSSMTPKAIAIIPNGINLKRYHQARVASGAKTVNSASARKNILYIGRLEKRKGVRYLLRAYAQLQEEMDVSLTLIGNGPQRKRLELRAQELGLRNVTFTGYISDRRKREMLRKTDLFCSPAPFGESFGVVLLEAMACGIPIVAGNNPGYRGVLQGLGSLSLVTPHDRAEFAGRLRLMLEEAQLRRMWRAWAKKTVPRYSYEKVVDDYEVVYERAIQERAKPRQLRLRQLTQKV
jgi:phosphatidylinositol alpha-mannosyltransferase